MDDELPSPFEVAIGLATVFGEETASELEYYEADWRAVARAQKKQADMLLAAVELLSEEVERLRIDRAT